MILKSRFFKNFQKLNKKSLSLKILIGVACFIIGYFCAFQFHSIPKISIFSKKKSVLNIPKEQNEGISCEKTNLKIDLIIRSYFGERETILNYLLPSILVYWPPSIGKVVFVLDDESEKDHLLGNELESYNLNHDIVVKYEKKPDESEFYVIPPIEWGKKFDFSNPPKNLKNRITLKGASLSGYHRQQWSNFHIDYQSDADIVGIMDSDSWFLSPFSIDTVVENDGRVISSAYNGKVKKWATVYDEGTQFAVHDKHIGRFMYNFPKYFRPKDMKDLREHVRKRTKSKTFDEAFGKIVANGKYSQFGIMYHYMYYYKNEHYSFRIFGDKSEKGIASIGYHKQKGNNWKIGWPHSLCSYRKEVLGMEDDACNKYQEPFLQQTSAWFGLQHFEYWTNKKGDEKIVKDHYEKVRARIKSCKKL